MKTHDKSSYRAGRIADGLPVVRTCLFSATPLIDFAPGEKYLDLFSGFLFDDGNRPPRDHDIAGRKAGAAIQPLDAGGHPAIDGKIVFLSIGFSNTSLKWAGENSGTPERVLPGSFTALTLASSDVNHTHVLILNGALEGHPTKSWVNPWGNNYSTVRDRVLVPRGVTEAQVQAIWMQLVERQPTVSLPSQDADAYSLLRSSGMACRALKKRYPNLKQVFISPRAYAGYSSTTLSPEPFAYETAFSVKWLVQAQVRQMTTCEINAVAGDLGDSAASWIGWGPYLWAEANHPRSDGFFSVREDFSDDGTHPSQQGIRKIGGFLLEWFLHSAYTPWFRNPWTKIRNGRFVQ